MRVLVNVLLCRVINIMHDSKLQNSNTAFRGQLRLNKQAGETKKEMRSISPGDLELIYERMFTTWKKCPFMLQVRKQNRRVCFVQMSLWFHV